MSTQWADTEVSPMDIDSLHLDEEWFIEVRHKKPRRVELDPPISPPRGLTFPSGPVSVKTDEL